MTELLPLPSTALGMVHVCDSASESATMKNSQRCGGDCKKGGHAFPSRAVIFSRSGKACLDSVDSTLPSAAEMFDDRLPERVYRETDSAHWRVDDTAIHIRATVAHDTGAHRAAPACDRITLPRSASISDADKKGLCLPTMYGSPSRCRCIRFPVWLATKCVLGTRSH